MLDSELSVEVPGLIQRDVFEGERIKISIATWVLRTRREKVAGI